MENCLSEIRIIHTKYLIQDTVCTLELNCVVLIHTVSIEFVKIASLLFSNTEFDTFNVPSGISLLSKLVSYKYRTKIDALLCVISERAVFYDNSVDIVGCNNGSNTIMLYGQICKDNGIKQSYRDSSFRRI